ncbi:MAG: hypothetical protein AB8F74_15205 [Saprospiraceae bacterium]
MISNEKKLRSLYEQLIAKEKIEIHLKNIDRILIMEEEALVEANGVLQREERDVTKLERKSLYVIFKSILGSLEEELEKERQEYLQAFLRKQSIEACISEMKKEKETLLYSYSGKFNIEREFEQVLAKLKKEIKESNPKLAQEIYFYEEKIARHNSKIKELKQAKRTGVKVIEKLRVILTSLEAIQEWGGNYSSRIIRQKQVAGTRMRTQIISAQKKLQGFENELFDLIDHYGHDYKSQIEEVRAFLNFFLNSLITDWIVKKKIEHSANVVSNLIDKVTLIIAMLEKDVEQTKGYIAQEKKDQRAIIVRKLKANK